MVDVTLSNDREITGVFAGDLVQAWQAGVAFAEQHVKASVDALVDFVVTSGGRFFRLTARFNQAVKGHGHGTAHRQKGRHNHHCGGLPGGGGEPAFHTDIA